MPDSAIVAYPRPQTLPLLREMETTVSGRQLDIYGQLHGSSATQVFPCPICGRQVSAGRFAPHLEKCMLGNSRKAANRAMGKIEASIRGETVSRPNLPGSNGNGSSNGTVHPGGGLARTSSLPKGQGVVQKDKEARAPKAAAKNGAAKGGKKGKVTKAAAAKAAATQAAAAAQVPPAAQQIQPPPLPNTNANNHPHAAIYANHAAHASVLKPLVTPQTQTQTQQAVLGVQSRAIEKPKPKPRAKVAKGKTNVKGAKAQAANNARAQNKHQNAQPKVGAQSVNPGQIDPIPDDLDLANAAAQLDQDPDLLIFSDFAGNPAGNPFLDNLLNV